MECSHLHLLHSILIILVYITNINSFSLNKNNSDNFEVNEEQTDIFGIKEVESDIYGLKEEESDIFGIIEEELEPFELKEEVSDIPTLGLERKYCDFCNLKDGKIYLIENTKDLNLEDYMREDYIWDGYSFCCDGIPDNNELLFYKANGITLKVVKKVNQSKNNKIKILNKRNEESNNNESEIHKLLKEAEKESQSIDTYEVKKVTTEQIYDIYRESKRKCLPLTSQNPLANPYSEKLTGRKFANVRLGYGSPVVLGVLKCDTEEQCEISLGYSKTMSFGYSYSLTDTDSKSNSYSYGNSQSNNIEESKGNDISDTIEVSMQNTRSRETSGSLSETFSEELSRTSEISIGYSYSKTKSEEETHTENHEVSRSDTTSREKSSTTGYSRDSGTSDSDNDISTNVCDSNGWNHDRGFSREKSKTDSEHHNEGSSTSEHVNANFKVVEAGVEHSNNSEDGTEKSKTKSTSRSFNNGWNGNHEQCITTSSSHVKTQNESWSNSETITNGFSHTDTYTDGISDSKTRGHSETNTYDTSTSDSISDAITSSYSTERGWTKGNSDTYGNNYSHTFGKSNNYSEGHTYSDEYNETLEKSKGLDIAKSFNNNTAVTLSTTVNYKLNKNESKYVVVRPLVHSIFIPWVCGIDNEEDYRTVDFYGKEVRVNYEFVYSEISIIEKDGEQPYTAYSVLDISDDEYMFEVAKTELQTARAFGENISGDEIVDFNLLRQGFYMTKTSSDIPESDSSAAKLLTTDKGMVKFYLKDDGNLVLTYGSDIIWQTHTDFLDNMASDMRFSIKKNGHLVLEAKNILVDGYRKDEWIPVWDSLPYDLDFNVGVAPRDQYKLLLAAPTKNTTPSYKARLELYDEYNVLIWSSEENLCKHYKGYILPQNYGIPTKIDIEPKFGVSRTFTAMLINIVMSIVLF